MWHWSYIVHMHVQCDGARLKWRWPNLYSSGIAASKDKKKGLGVLYLFQLLIKGRHNMSINTIHDYVHDYCKFQISQSNFSKSLFYAFRHWQIFTVFWYPTKEWDPWESSHIKERVYKKWKRAAYIRIGNWVVGLET